MNKKTTARQHTSSLISKLITESNPLEKAQVRKRMELAAKLEDFLNQKKWSKKEFSERIGENPSEITKWLSGTHNFNEDILTENAILPIVNPQQ